MSTHSAFPPARLSRFSWLAWGSLFFNLAVIVWGAFVRASGSGAGCGSHWPLCNGEMIPTTGLLTTAIEFAHRISSGVCLLLAAAVAYLGHRDYPKSSLVRKASYAVLGFTLSEALIGAGLVLLRYVDQDQSIGRVISICLHLFNTFLLLACLTLAAWGSTYEPTYRLEPRPRRSLKTWRLAITALILATLLGVTGAVTALGDTLFRATSLTSGLRQDFATASHFLLKLRVIHPMLAVLTAGFLFYFAEFSAVRSPRLALWLRGLVATQLLLGLTNLLLLAPTALQLAHLFVAESLWIILVLNAAVTLQAETEAC